MKKYVKLICLSLTATLLLLMCACGGDADTQTTSEAASITLTDEETTLEVQSTSESVSLEETALSEETTLEDETTQAEIPDMPQSKADILAAYTAVVNKVKVDKPKYVSNDWQTLNNLSMGKVLYKTLSSIAGSFLETKEETEPDPQDAGNRAKWFALPTTESGGDVGCVLTRTDKIESATCTKDGDSYIIKITLKPEKDPYADMDNPTSVTSWHGQMFHVIDITQVVEYAKKVPGVDTDDAYCTFHGTATLKYNPVTNECESLDHVVDVRIFLGEGECQCVADYRFYDFAW